jgi:hypothetical protein
MIRFIRLYTPFVLSIMAGVNAILLSYVDNHNAVNYITNIVSGSILVDIYFISVSLRTCVWYKMNIVCLILIHITNIIYNEDLISKTMHLNIVTILSVISLIMMMLIRILYNAIK